MKVSYLDESYLGLIRGLACKIWPEAYRDVLSKEQINFMLEDIYSLDALRKQLREGAQFILASAGDKALGFASFTCQANLRNVRVHKLYVLADQQKKGVGKNLLASIESQAFLTGAECIELNVNRRNPAVGFYMAAGFSIRQSIDIPYFKWVLDDYIMEKRLI